MSLTSYQQLLRIYSRYKNKKHKKKNDEHKKIEW